MTKRAKYRFLILNLLEDIFAIILAIVLVLAFFRFVMQPITIDGTSMIPTLKDKENILVKKIGSKLNYDRYDIIVFKPYDEDDPSTPEDESDTLFIKRIIGLPGETVCVAENGEITITNSNGNSIILNDDPFKQEKYNKGIDWDQTDTERYETVTLGKDEYFVMGDNRQNSHDSRSTELQGIHSGCILGKYVFKIPF